METDINPSDLLLTQINKYRFFFLVLAYGLGLGGGWGDCKARQGKTFLKEMNFKVLMKFII